VRVIEASELLDIDVFQCAELTGRRITLGVVDQLLPSGCAHRNTVECAHSTLRTSTSRCGLTRHAGREI
jgi:hypothetical protein